MYAACRRDRVDREFLNGHLNWRENLAYQHGGQRRRGVARRLSAARRVAAVGAGLADVRPGQIHQRSAGKTISLFAGTDRVGRAKRAAIETESRSSALRQNVSSRANIFQRRPHAILCGRLPANARGGADQSALGGGISGYGSVFWVAAGEQAAGVDTARYGQFHGGMLPRHGMRQVYATMRRLPAAWLDG